MTTRPHRVICTAVASWVTTAGLLAAPLGQPTPGPCTADGSCMPARTTWGYHRTQWRLWPGTSIDDGRAREEAAYGSGFMGPTANPDPRVEDKQAPPKVEALDPEAAEPPDPDDNTFELPEMDTPDPERPAAADPLTPPPPGFMNRPPGELPFGQPANADDSTPQVPQPSLPFGQPPAEAPRPPADLFPSNSQGQPVGPRFSGDAPPALPFAIQPQARPVIRRAPSSSFVLPASVSGEAKDANATASRIPTAAAPQHVQRAAAISHFGDAPPHMPQGWFDGR